MSTTELRRRAKAAIDALTGRQLQVAADLLAIVQRASARDATRELLEIPGFLRSFARGVRDARAERVREWRRVRDDV